MKNKYALEQLEKEFSRLEAENKLLQETNAELFKTYVWPAIKEKIEKERFKIKPEIGTISEIFNEKETINQITFVISEQVYEFYGSLKTETHWIERARFKTIEEAQEAIKILSMKEVKHD